MILQSFWKKWYECFCENEYLSVVIL